MTEKLYDLDSSICSFDARVTGCAPAGKGWTVTLDRTAFFPEGGGQQADTGSIGGARVTDVQETDGEILHYTDRPLPEGERFSCALDREQRRRRMQNHSGEHVISGLIHSLYGWENVGFHMGESCMTMDYSGELSWEELMRVETLANEAVRDDLPIRAWYPAPEELAQMVYRSKLELTENVRIVEIPGIDRCACCAPHVKRTGEIGTVKILTAERHRGGTRITALCGMDAAEDYRRRQDSVAAISALLSAKRDEVAPAVERLLAERDALKERTVRLSEALVKQRAESTPCTQGNLCVFDGELLNEAALRELVNLLMERCGGMAAAFSGSDETGYRYIIGSRSVDLRAHAKEINAGIGGKGGGSSAMIQGRAACSASAIKKYLETAIF
ncbi:MAG: alanyl-tRNA editing protein [Oscillospiraceae bacterium]|nr:alanyl-tRNA editing protein [Oscillospiraceae bacterium]